MHLSVTRLRRGFIAALTLGAATSAAAQDGQGAVAARRIADVTAISLAEYAEGVEGGMVVRPEEFREARLFLMEVRETVAELPGAVQPAVRDHLDRIEAGVTALRSEADLLVLMAELRQTLETALDVRLDPLPMRAPSLARGAAIYAENCAQCHGASGAGDGPAAQALNPPPADLSDRTALRAATPIEFLRKLNVGVAGTAMPGFADLIELDDRWAVVAYVTALRFAAADTARGRDFMERVCTGCVGLVGDYASTVSLSDDSLAALIRVSSESRLDDTTLAALVAYGRSAGAAENLGRDNTARMAAAVARSKQLLRQAVDQAGRGETRRANRTALNAYLAFERVETLARVKDPAATRRLESEFSALRRDIQTGVGVEPLALRHSAVENALDSVLDQMLERTSLPVLLGQSLIIMLREGIEAILIVGALVAFLAKAGASERKRDIGIGVLAAVGASVVTAAAFATVFRAATAHQELLEGLTMLVAAAVLFWVSYWLVSKVELRKWQAFVRDRMQQALASRRQWALAAVAFLAVYREGFETVLFYAALFTTADGPAAVGAVVAGMLISAVLLVILYAVMQRYSGRLPLRPFFAVTSALLYVMAFSFAGRAIAELQEAGIVSATPLAWLPSVPALGIYPTYQSFLVQLFVGAALVAALVWVFWLQPRTAQVARRT
jgi:high-affinity iron transporter